MSLRLSTKPSPHLLPFAFQAGLSLNSELTDLITLDCPQAPAIHLPLMSCPPLLPHMWVLGFWSQVLILVQQIFYRLKHFPKPPMILAFINYWSIILKSLSQHTSFFFSPVPWAPRHWINWPSPRADIASHTVPRGYQKQDNIPIFKTCVSSNKNKEGSEILKVYI